MTQPALTRDPETSALYIEMLDTEIAETVELAKGVYVDLDAEGQLVGIEILNADASLLASVPALPDKAMLRDLLKPNAD